MFELGCTQNGDRFWKNFRITPDINYASAVLSPKTMANSPEYCIYTSVMSTYCVDKRGFQFLSFLSFSTLLFLFFCPSHSPTTLFSAPRFSFSFFFLGSRRYLNQRFPVALAYLFLFHATRPRRYVTRIPWSKN